MSLLCDTSMVKLQKILSWLPKEFSTSLGGEHPEDLGIETVVGGNMEDYIQAEGKLAD